ncbi:MAG: oxidoreductase [Gemmatimonadetes bacterium]|nr:oxidoreductase [Gemmatimonadota bacterium]
MADDLQGGLIGCGYFARNHLNGWREVEGAGIVSLCDQDQEALGQAASDFGIPEQYTDPQAMLESEDLDFVDVVTQAPSHRFLVELVAASGAHVICQKPFAPTLDDARSMVVACNRAGVKLMVHENFRWQRPMRELYEVVSSGAIGEPFFARVEFRSAWDVYANQPYLATDERFIVYDLGIHLLDLARFFLGEVEQLYARSQRVNPDIRAEDVATIVMDVAGGKTCVVEASYASKLEHEVFPQTLIKIEGERGAAVLGRDYALSVTNEAGTETRAVPPHTFDWSESPGQAIQDGVVSIQRHWVECLRTDAEPETSGSDNLRTLELVFGTYRSAEERSVYRTERSLGSW